MALNDRFWEETDWVNLYHWRSVPLKFCLQVPKVLPPSLAFRNCLLTKYYQTYQVPPCSGVYGFLNGIPPLPPRFMNCSILIALNCGQTDPGLGHVGKTSLGQRASLTGQCSSRLLFCGFHSPVPQSLSYGKELSTHESDFFIVFHTKMTMC